ncbi:MAG: zinc ribbon domain-containing protein, partial [Cyanobacteria bacterium J06560_2]
VLIKDHHPAYISWAQYEQHLAQLKSNRARADECGHARSGVALLSGLLTCGRCGARMTVRYHRGQASHHYVCNREMAEYGGELCQQLAGACLDESVTEQVLRALEPAALELSLTAATHIEQDRTELDKLWHQRLERASFESERAGRHYHLVEPENRLVARQLGQEWENVLQAEQQLKEDYERFSHEQPKKLTDEEQKEIRHLAESFPRLWSAETTTHVQRKEIVRQIIQKITVNVEGESEQVQVSIEWNGGFVAQVSVIRPVAKWTQLSNYPQLCQRLVQMAKAKLPTDEMIELLHREGFHPPKRRKTFNSEVLRSLMRRLGLGTRRSPKPREPLAKHEWWLPDLAITLKMPEVTLYNWIRRGWVNARQQPDPPKHWIVWADEAELERLRTHRQRPAGEVLRLHWKGGTSDITRPPETC